MFSPRILLFSLLLGFSMPAYAAFDGPALQKGESNAPVTIIMAVDYEDPFSQRFWQQTYPTLQSSFIDKGTMRIVIRQHPLSFHPHAMDAARAVECLRRINEEKAWRLHVAFLTSVNSQGEFNLDVETMMKNIAGSDASDVTRCMVEGDADETIKTNMGAAVAMGLSGTPTFWLQSKAGGEQKIAGAQPLESFLVAINAILPSSSASSRGRESSSSVSRPSRAAFTDVASTHANAEAIAYVKAEGIVDGYADGTFRPNQTINRAEFTKIIVNSDTTSEDKSTHCSSYNLNARSLFSDVSGDEWFVPYLCAARGINLIGGYPDGTFRPGSAINFAEAAKIIAQVHAYPVTADAAVWYRGSVEALGERHAIPVSIDSFEKKLTRGEMAEMIWRLKAEVTNKPSRTYGELGFRTADSGETGLPFSFSYPASWGELEKVGDGYGLWRLTGLRGTPFAVDISITAKKPGLQFITKPCNYIGCPQDTDFDTYRASLKTNRTTGGGIRVSQRDNYSAPSGSFHRNAEFFAGDYQVMIGGWADFLVYDKEYDRRVSQGLSPSISEIVFEDISSEDEHPMDIVFGLYPSETVTEQRFFRQIDAMIGSIR